MRKTIKIQKKMQKYAKKFAYIKKLYYLCTEIKKQDGAATRNSGKKVMTRNQLQAAAEKAGVKFEINPRYSEDSVYNHETRKFEKVQTGWYFGINNLSGRDIWSWTWFETIGMNDDEFWFVERYSMRTGKSNKGWRERMTAHERVANLLGISLAQLFNF